MSKLNPNACNSGEPGRSGSTNGPTVRSDIAKHCMQGLLAYHPGSRGNINEVAKDAVAAADALIAELNKTTPLS